MLSVIRDFSPRFQFDYTFLMPGSAIKVVIDADGTGVAPRPTT